MSRIDGNTPGIHQPTRDYDTNPLGKFGDRKAKLENTESAPRSSSKPGLGKRIKHRLATLAKTTSAKVRRFNHQQKEMGRRTGNLVGKVSDPQTCTTSNIHKSLKAICSIGNKMDSMISESDSDKRFQGQLDVHLSKLSLADLTTLEQNLSGIDFDSYMDGLNEDLKEFGKQLDDIQPGLGLQSSLSNNIDSPTSEVAQLKKAFQDLKNSVSTNKEAKAVQDLQTSINKILNSQPGENRSIDLKLCKALHDAGVSADQGAAFYGLENGSMDTLCDLVTLGLSADDVMQLNQSGKTIDDVRQLQTQFPNVSISDIVANIWAVDATQEQVSSFDNSGVADLTQLRCLAAGLTKSQSDTIAQVAPEGVDGVTAYLVEMKNVGWDIDTIEVVKQSDQAPTEVRQASGGAIAETFMVKFSDGNDGTITRFFSKETREKPEAGCWKDLFNSPPDPPRLAQRNIASSKLDEALGFSLIAKSEIGTLKHPGTNKTMVGTFMHGAKGKSAQDTPLLRGEIFGLTGKGWENKEDIHTLAKGLTSLLEKPGEWEYYPHFDPSTSRPDFAKLQSTYMDQGMEISLPEGTTWESCFDDNNNFTGDLNVRLLKKGTQDLSTKNGQLRQQVTRLQYMDILAGQFDRSSGNYFVDKDSNGKVTVTGIDNDMAWGDKLQNREQFDALSTAISKNETVKMRKLPMIADQSTKNAFDQLNSNPSQLDEMFKDLLSPEEIAAAKGRLSMICDHLADLAQDGKIIEDDQWEQATANSFFESATPSDSYLARDQKYFKKD